ncbi:MAG TPA: UDP-N-acetylmuramoyl-tripeptide--D-alanyl-D-alanine ligase [Acidimicrobiales bacterium]|nr:UDP-N-acetylmuramoyl-tripeptide--D-alanyl-D-alanine ligase [Acidimicrobiales bacterium]
MNSRALEVVVLCASLVAIGLAYLRWLRVAQREHYLAGSTTKFARRWWLAGAINQVAFFAAVVGAVISAWYAVAAFMPVLVAVMGPFGFGLRGRTSKLAWTGRLRRLATTSAIVLAIVLGVAGIFGLHPALTAGAMAAVAAPVLVDVALALARPVESRLLAPYVAKASKRLTAVSPRVVAITGSYGKTTTKGYVAHLVGATFSVVASPASFNNTAGLARAVNEHLGSGTGVFVAEMGTYGQGEIRDMCQWARPEIAMITAIGPVHLERMGSLERIAEAKAEILAGARVAILNVDYPLLEELAQKIEESGKSLWRCSCREPRADVRVTVEEGKIHVLANHLEAEMDVFAHASPEVEPGNVACAVAAALSLGVPPEVVEARLGALPVAPHRRNIGRNGSGAWVIDDTYNANPAGAASALALLATLGDKDAKRVVVTPGMVELGVLQARENANFAARAGEVASELCVVGRTNARALLAGARAAGLPARRARNRQLAVGWAAAELGDGDAVLYENDLPDHYP